MYNKKYNGMKKIKDEGKVNDRSYFGEKMGNISLLPH